MTNITFENIPKIGSGIYTTADVAWILGVTYPRAHRWITKYWDGDLGKEFEQQYSWQTDESRAVSFHTVVEFYVMIQLSEKGVKTKEILKAHRELSHIYRTAFPFAMKEVLEELQTDGKVVYWKKGEHIVTLNGSQQFNLSFIHLFFKKLEFDGDNMVSRLWPMGKDNSIVIDPERKFGHPIIVGRNIYPETIFNHYKAGDPPSYIAHIYKITEKEVADAITFCKRAA